MALRALSARANNHDGVWTWHEKADPKAGFSDSEGYPYVSILTQSAAYPSSAVLSAWA